jgi:hypothetical protein
MGCNNSNNKSIEQPLNIIVAIDFDSSRINNESLITRDTVIINYILDYFTKIQKEKKFNSKDNIVVVSFNMMENNNAFEIKAEDLQNENGGYYGLQKNINNIKNNIVNAYKKYQYQKVSSEFYRFFKDELAHYIKDGYNNKLIILSNGTSIIKEEMRTTNYKTFIHKSEYLKVLNNNDWETSGLAQEIELSPIYNKKNSNLDVLMPELSPLESDNYLNENALLKKIWESWLAKSGFNYSIKPASSDMLSYKETIESFLNQTTVQNNDITVKNRSNKYVEYLNLENKELLQGLVGNYYLVDIRSAETKKIIVFNSGKYFIDSFSEEYDKPMIEFKSNILDVIENSTSLSSKFKVFVKGSADIKGNLTFRQKINPNYPYTGISYFKKMNNSEYKYVSERGETQIKNDIYTNAELPNLRAYFIKDIFQEKYQINDFFGEIGILDGSISQDTTFAGRNVKIILYLTH